MATAIGAAGGFTEVLTGMKPRTVKFSKNYGKIPKSFKVTHNITQFRVKGRTVNRIQSRATYGIWQRTATNGQMNGPRRLRLNAQTYGRIKTSIGSSRAAYSFSRFAAKNPVIASYGAGLIGSYAGQQAGMYLARRAVARGSGKRAYNRAIKGGATHTQATIKRRQARTNSLNATRYRQKASLRLQNPEKYKARQAAKRKAAGGGRRPPQLTASQRAQIARRRKRDGRGRFR